MAEILLEEIARCPGPEMDNAEDREGYSLVAGFSLGLVLLGQGDNTMRFLLQTLLVGVGV